MVFEYELTIPANTPVASPVSQPMQLTHGIVHKVEVVGDGGEHGQVKVVIRKAIHQVFPQNPDGQFHPGFFPIAYPTWYELEVEPYQLEAFGWSPGTEWAHYAIIRLGMERREILQPERGPMTVLRRVAEFLTGKT